MTPHNPTYGRGAPQNKAYAKSGKAYVYSLSFKPLFLKTDAAQYLSQVRSIAERVITPEDAWVGNLPAFDATPAPTRVIDPVVLRSIVIAIRRHEAIKVLYQSRSAPDPEWRWIAPHALTFDGFRWCARSFSEKSGECRDFVISRIIETRQTRAAKKLPVSDVAWDEMVELEVGLWDEKWERDDPGTQSAALLCAEAAEARHRSFSPQAAGSADRASQ